MTDQPTTHEKPWDPDPGPVPETPDIPPLDLRARIANAIEQTTVRPSLVVSDEFEATVAAVHAAVSAGADWTPRDPATEMTAAQALAYLLDLPEWARLERLGHLLDRSRQAADCYEQDHVGRYAELVAIRVQRDRYHYALTQIGRLKGADTSGDVVMQIITEALVRQ